MENRGEGEVRITIGLTSVEAAALDDWIARHRDRHGTREEAALHLLKCALIEHPGQ